MSNQLLFTMSTFYSLVLFLPLAALILWVKPSLWLPLLTLFIGVIIGLLDQKTTEVQVSALMLLTFGFFAGFAQANRAWLWALLIGVWVPIFGFINSGLGITHPTSTELVTSWLAVAFSLAGAYAGALVSRLAPREAQPIMRI